MFLTGKYTHDSGQVILELKVSFRYYIYYTNFEQAQYDAPDTKHEYSPFMIRYMRMEDERYEDQQVWGKSVKEELMKWDGPKWCSDVVHKPMLNISE